MSLNLGLQSIRRLPFAAACLALAALPFAGSPTSRARERGPQDFLGTYSGGQDIGGQQDPDMQVPAAKSGVPQPGRRTRSRQAGTKRAAGPVPRLLPGPRNRLRDGWCDRNRHQLPERRGADSGANCVGCHRGDRPGLTRGKLDMTSFAKLMQGTPKEKVIEPTKPDDSHLILRVKGEETPRMPPGR